MENFSRVGIDELGAILSAEFDGDQAKTKDAISEMCFCVSLVASVEAFGDPKQMVLNYKNVLSAISKLEQTFEALGVEEIETLSDLIEGFESDEILAQFDQCLRDPPLSGVYGTTIWETRTQLQILSHTIDHALSRIKVRRGAKPKDDMRMLADVIKDALESYGITPTTYDDGVYFRVLEIAFRECFESPGPESHRRHGATALADDDDDDEASDHDIKYLPPGALHTD